MSIIYDAWLWGFLFALVGVCALASFAAWVHQEAENHLVEIKAAIDDDFVDMKTAVWVSDRLRWIRRRYGIRYRLRVDVRGDRPSTLHLSG